MFVKITMCSLIISAFLKRRWHFDLPGQREFRSDVHHRNKRGWQISCHAYHQRFCTGKEHFICYQHHIHILFQRNLLWIADFDTNNIVTNIKWIKLVNEFTGEFDVYVLNASFIVICLIPQRRLTNKESLFYIRTNLSALRYKVVTIDVANRNQMKDLIPESDAFLSQVISVNKNYFALIYKRNVGLSVYPKFLQSFHLLAGQGRVVCVFAWRDSRYPFGRRLCRHH